MSKHPLVSIIIPTKNEEKNIVRSLKSLKAQTYPNLEIVLVDNHSTDKTLKLARPYVTKTIISGPERSSQRNIGAKKAKGEWLLFIDADMESSRGLVSECVELTRKSKSKAVVVANEEAKGYDFWGKALALERKTYRYSPTFVTAARFFPKDDFLKLGGYDKQLISGEDWDLTQRFKDEGYPIFMTQKSYLRHHEAKTSLHELLKKEVFYIKHIKEYAKKHPKAFSYQGSFLYRGLIYARAWKTLIKHPLHSLAFLFYKFLVFFIWQWYKITS